MTREDVARMARECGNDNEHTLQSDMDFLVVFAQKVAAAEREACAKKMDAVAQTCREENSDHTPFEYAAAVIRARGVK